MIIMASASAFCSVQQIQTADTLIVDKGEHALWPRTVNEELLEQYRNQPEYYYDLQPIEQESLLSKIKSWLMGKILALIKKAGNLWVLRYFVIGGILLFFIFRMTKTSFSGIINPTKQIVPILFSDQEDPSQIQWENLIQQAKQENNFRLAVRYHFLNTLKMLSRKGIIKWQNQKTNRQYEREIINEILKDSFHQISGLYEAVWYGNFTVKANDYLLIEQDFNSFNKSLSTQQENTLNT